MMKISKLLTIKLVAHNYIVVEDDGQNRTIQMGDTSKYRVGGMFEMTSELDLKRSAEL